MRFTKLEIDGFGCLKAFESPEIEEDVVIVCGRNESGKSTLFTVVETLLYGWSPASPTTNPYVPWDGSVASCSGLLYIGEEYLHIGRRLMSRPQGFLKVGEDQGDIANRCIPLVEHISRDIYRQVYALTADELSLPNNLLWEKLEDQLLGGQYYSSIRSANIAMEELDSEANSLWRPDRRGKPRAKLLRDELSRLRGELSRAKENDERLYELEKGLKENEESIYDMRREKIELTSYITWCESLQPIKKKEDEMNKLLDLVEDVEPLQGLPLNVEDEFYGLEDRIIKVKKDIHTKRLEEKELEEIKNSLTDIDIVLIEVGREIEDLIRSYDRMAEHIDRVIELERERDRIDALLRCNGDELIIGGWKDVYRNALGEIDEALLRQKVILYRDLKLKLDEKRLGISALAANSQSIARGAKLTPIGIGFSILGIAGLFLPNSLLKFGGILSLTIALVLFIFSRTIKEGEKEHRELIRRTDEEVGTLEERLREVQAELHSSLLGIPFASLDEGHMGDSIIVDVDRLRGPMKRLEELIGKEKYIKNELDAKTKMVNSILDRTLLGPGRDILEDIDNLNNNLKMARERELARVMAEGELEELVVELDQLDGELDRLEEEREDFISKLNRFHGESLDEKMKDVGRRRQLHSKAMLLREQIEIDKMSLPDNCFNDLNRWYIDNRETDQRVLDFDKLAYAKVRVEELDSSINNLNAETGALKKELEYGREKKTAYEIRGEMDSIEEELDDIAERRDRLILLKNIIDRADRKFREDHQPDILHRAGKYLKIITGGKYSRIFISDDSNNKVAILQGDNPYPIEVVNTISRGTQEQIYLALRLAMMDHLDGEYPMPIFLDEVFINWDGARIKNSLKLLEKISKKRQVFIFTCHNWLVDILSNNLNVQVLAMDEIE